MNFTVKSLEIFWALKEIVELDLVPSNFNPFILIKCSVPESIKIQERKSNQKKKKTLQELNRKKVSISADTKKFFKNLNKSKLGIWQINELASPLKRNSINAKKEPLWNLPEIFN